MDTVLTLIQGPAGALVLALLILYGGRKKWWVFGWQYTELLHERDEWKTAALRGTRIAERVVTIHELDSKERDDRAQ